MSVFSFEITFITFVFLLYLKMDISFYSVVLLFGVVLFASFVLTKRSENSALRYNPLLFPALLFFLTMLPSLSNVTNIALSVSRMMNYIFIVLISFTIGAAVTNYDQIKKGIFAFLVVSVANAVYVIQYGLATSKRSFGFVGVVYVDYVCIVLVLLTIYFFLNKKRLVVLFSILFFLLSMILTQTRNTVLSLVLTFFIVLIILIRRSEHFSLKKKNLVAGLVTFLFLFTFIIGVISIVAPDSLSRLVELNSNTPAPEIKDEEDIVGVNSLVTRLMIWHTCSNAFISHPVIGIGAYSFALESAQYYTIPTFVYKAFVEGASPHVTYLAVLTESGIIGFIGFMVFLIASMKISVKSMNLANNNESKQISLIILSVQIYISLSMLMSDAWLWGLCAAMWAFWLGLAIANYRIIVSTKVA